MERLSILLAIVMFMAAGASARSNYSHDASLLPESAKSVIANNCKTKVSVVKIDKNFGRVNEYEVTLTDGTEISFDREGNWKSVETRNTNSVPVKFVPSNISNYIYKNQSGTRIVGIEKERRGYDVELSNGVDMKFDKMGNFIRYDD